MTLHGQRAAIESASCIRAAKAAAARSWTAGPSRVTTDMQAAIRDRDGCRGRGAPELPPRGGGESRCRRGKAVLCTKPLGRTADEALRMLEAVEKAGVFGGYLEDLCYTPKTLKAIASARSGAIGEVTWVRSRETHPGPHSAWFWDGRLTGGGAIIDLGCHCVEIIRNFVGKGNRPVEVMCTTDTLVTRSPTRTTRSPSSGSNPGHRPVRGQLTFRGGMDLRDEVAGTHGTIWLNHFLRTGFEMFTAGGSGGYVAEKAETTAGWLFPVGDEVSELGYVDMFTTCSARWTRVAFRRRRSTTATS